MAGLESIALAVAHLEREAEKGTHLTRVNIAKNNWVNHCSTERAKGSFVIAMPPTPARCSFNDNIPRRVSTDSNYSEKPNNLPEGKDSTRMMQALRPPPSDLPLSLESLSESEHDGPPPPAPSPTDVITHVNKSDVLCGRGGETNHHPGNVKYRALVKRFQPLYIVSKRRDKPRIAEKIVHTIRQRGGRFLKKDSYSNTWRDVGNTKAREKTSQALREGAPELRSTPAKGKEESFSVTHTAKSSKVKHAVHPTLVETELSEVGRVGTIYTSPGALKRRRLNVAGYVPSGSLNVPVSNYGIKGNPRMIPGFVASLPLACDGRLCIIPPGNFPATVSADDEDCHSEELNRSHPTRGPRLKLLKKRLQDDSKV